MHDRSLRTRLAVGVLAAALFGFGCTAPESTNDKPPDTGSGSDDDPTPQKAEDHTLRDDGDHGDGDHHGGPFIFDDRD